MRNFFRVYVDKYNLTPSRIFVAFAIMWALFLIALVEGEIMEIVWPITPTNYPTSYK